MKRNHLKLLLLICIIFLGTSCEQLADLEAVKDKVESNLPKPPNLIDGEEWVLVPTNAGGLGLPPFYVMKYEAKPQSYNTGEYSSIEAPNPGQHRAVSVAENQPWRGIHANEAATACEARGAGFHLISNTEWMAIARDIEAQDSNWLGGSVGFGCLLKGNTMDTTCGYNSLIADSGTSRNSKAKLVLSNGQALYDLAGNLNEWTDWNEDQSGFQLAPQNCPEEWTELADVTCLSGVDYNTANSTYDSSHGVGQFFGGTGGAALRGGSRLDFANGGLFKLTLTFPINASSSNVGFRCVYRL